MQYIFRTDRGYLKDAAPRNPHFASRATLKLGGKGGGELNLEPQTDETKEKQVVNICNIHSVHRWGPQISLGFLTNTEKELHGKTTQLNERRRTAADDDGRT